MKTADALFKQYGRKFLPAELIIPEYWGYRCDEIGDITKLVGKDKLNGLKPFRLGKNYMIDIDDLALVLDRIR